MKVLVACEYSGIVRDAFAKRGHDAWSCDILPTENSVDLFNYMASAVLSSVSGKTGHGSKLWDFIKSLRPVVSYDSYSGIPNLSFSLKPDESQRSMHDLLKLMEEAEKPVLFAIDEFQQILNYPESNTDAWLRKTVQDLKNAVLIYSGSQQHLIDLLFSNPSRPFFRSTQLIQLDKIASGLYSDFIIRQFRKNDRKISVKTAG